MDTQEVKGEGVQMDTREVKGEGVQMDTQEVKGEGVQMDTQEVKRRRCPNGHPGSKEEKVSKWTPRK